MSRRLSTTLGLLICVAFWCLSGEVKAQNEKATRFGEGLFRLPQIAFPRSDHPRGRDHFLLGDRDLSIKYRRANLYISRARAFELTFDESDFYLRLGGRAFIDLAGYSEDKNDLGDNGLGLRNLQIFSARCRFRPSISGQT